MQPIFSSLNYKILGVCVALLVVGYVLLAQGPATNPLSFTVAPLLLVVVYLVLIPFAILVKGKEKETPKEQQKKGV
jgi:hypothetical protein